MPQGLNGGFHSNGMVFHLNLGFKSCWPSFSTDTVSQSDPNNSFLFVAYEECLLSEWERWGRQGGGQLRRWKGTWLALTGYEARQPGQPGQPGFANTQIYKSTWRHPDFPIVQFIMNDHVILIWASPGWIRKGVKAGHWWLVHAVARLTSCHNILRLLDTFCYSVYKAWNDFWPQVRGLRRESLERQEASPATSDRTSLTRGDRISGSRPTSPLGPSKDCNAAPAHWNASKLPAPGLRCTQSVPFRQRWRSVKRQRGDKRHCRGHLWNAFKSPEPPESILIWIFVLLALSLIGMELSGQRWPSLTMARIQRFECKWLLLQSAGDPI